MILIHVGLYYDCYIKSLCIHVLLYIFDIATVWPRPSEILHHCPSVLKDATPLKVAYPKKDRATPRYTYLK